MTKFLKISILTLGLFLAGSGISELPAQCPMCKMAAESNMKNGGSAGKGLNKGILFMFATPYLLVLGVGVYWYQNNGKEANPE